MPSIIADNYREPGGDLYFLGSRSSGNPNDVLEQRAGFLGGSMGFIYDRIPLYADSINRSDTIILFNTQAENIEILEQWPDQDSQLQPFSVSNLIDLQIPSAA